jgi:hypothetical protein
LRHSRASSRSSPQEILVVHDELDVVPGQAKLKFGGSHAGHNGLRDIHAQLGTADYWRLRVGIGHPGVKSEVVNWVLKKPLKEQREAIEDAIVRTLHAVPALLAGEMEKATLADPHEQAAAPQTASAGTGRRRHACRHLAGHRSAGRERNKNDEEEKKSKSWNGRSIFDSSLRLGYSAFAQDEARTWRCGNTYSDQPCEGGKPVKVNDSRSDQDRREADAGTRNAQTQADHLERNRLSQEKAAHDRDTGPRAKPEAQRRPKGGWPCRNNGKGSVPARRRAIPASPARASAARPARAAPATHPGRRRKRGRLSRCVSRERPEAGSSARLRARGGRRHLDRREALVLLHQRLAAFRMFGIQRNAGHRADLHALRLVEVADAFGALVRVDLVEGLAHVDGIVRALGLADIAVDAFVGDHEGHPPIIGGSIPAVDGE